MDISSIPDAFQSRIRLGIITGLLDGPKTFSELKALVQATDGNMSAHLNRLEEMALIQVKKEFVGRKPRSTYTLTEIGLNLFQKYVLFLEQMLNKAMGE